MVHLLVRCAVVSRPSALARGRAAPWQPKKRLGVLAGVLGQLPSDKGPTFKPLPASSMASPTSPFAILPGTHKQPLSAARWHTQWLGLRTIAARSSTVRRRRSTTSPARCALSVVASKRGGGVDRVAA